MARPRNSLAHASSFLLVASLVGCAGSTPTGDAGPRPDGAPVACGDPVFVGEPSMTADLGAYDGDALVPWVDGQDVPFVWGLQGGTMITPTVHAPAAINPAGASCVVVEIRNLEPEGGVVFEAFRALDTRLEAAVVGDQLEVRDLFDQLGWIEIPRDTPLSLEVTVRGLLGAARARVELRIVPPGAPLPAHCEALPTHGIGCRFRSIPATATVTAIRAHTESEPWGTCPLGPQSPMIVEYRVSIDEAYRDCSSATMLDGLTLLVSGSYALPQACVEAASLSVGTTFPVTSDESFAGGCSPYSVTAPILDRPECGLACTGAM